jgi:mannose-6-phosphate isomerase-like protein (cupin superfamily)
MHETPSSLHSSDSSGPGRPVPRRIALDPAATEYTRVLGGPPETVTMRAGQVVLAPGKSVGRHSTEGYEEILVILAGEGELHFPHAGEVGKAGIPMVELNANVVAYCPPQTEHDVINTGSEPLRYLFIVARALQS